MKIYTQTTGNLDNLLPRISFEEIEIDGVEFNDKTNDELKPEIEKFVNENHIDLNLPDTQLMNAIDVFQNGLKMIVRKWFIRKFGKSMNAKFAGKTIDGQMFGAGAEIIFWSNGVDKAVILQ